MTCYEGDKFEGFKQYMMYGGMPYCVLEKDESKKIDYLKSLLNETYLKDIIEKNNIRNIKELDELLSIVSSSIGSLTNPYKLSNTFESVKNITISKTLFHIILCYLKILSL